MHLLLVEDDPRLVRLLTRLLTQDRHVVDSATTAAEGSSSPPRPQLDAVILDVGLPGRLGLRRRAPSACQRLGRADPHADRPRCRRRPRGGPGRRGRRLPRQAVRLRGELLGPSPGAGSATATARRVSPQAAAPPRLRAADRPAACRRRSSPRGGCAARSAARPSRRTPRPWRRSSRRRAAARRPAASLDDGLRSLAIVLAAEEVRRAPGGRWRARPPDHTTGCGCTGASRPTSRPCGRALAEAGHEVALLTSTAGLGGRTGPAEFQAFGTERMRPPDGAPDRQPVGGGGRCGGRCGASGPTWRSWAMVELHLSPVGRARAGRRAGGR